MNVIANAKVEYRLDRELLEVDQLTHADYVNDMRVHYPEAYKRCLPWWQRTLWRILKRNWVWYL